MVWIVILILIAVDALMLAWCVALDRALAKVLTTQRDAEAQRLRRAGL